jgi:hypothetical protein
MIDNTAIAYSQKLIGMDIENSIVEHPSLRDPQEVQSYLGLTLADGLSTMLMKAGDEFIIILRRCDTRLDSGKLREGHQQTRYGQRMNTVRLLAVCHGAARCSTPGWLLSDEQLLKRIPYEWFRGLH